MAEASTVAAIARVDILARSAEEAERKAFKAASATLIKGLPEVQFAGEVELSARNAAQSGKGMAATEEGRSPFGHRGLVWQPNDRVSVAAEFGNRAGKEMPLGLDRRASTNSPR